MGGFDDFEDQYWGWSDSWGVADETFGDGDWLNEFDSHDCNHDGFVSALDALMIVNHLGSGARAAGDSGLDVNGDDSVTAFGALMVINCLAQNAANSPVLAFITMDDADDEWA